MKFFRRIKEFCARVWRSVLNGLRRPSLEFIAGSNSGAAMGRVFLWSYMAAILFMIGAPIAAVLALVMALWELYLGWHVFRAISQAYAAQVRGVAQAVIHVPVYTPDTLAS